MNVIVFLMLLVLNRNPDEPNMHYEKKIQYGNETLVKNEKKNLCISYNSASEASFEIICIYI